MDIFKGVRVGSDDIGEIGGIIIAVVLGVIDGAIGIDVFYPYDVPPGTVGIPTDRMGGRIAVYGKAVLLSKVFPTRSIAPARDGESPVFQRLPAGIAGAFAIVATISIGITG